VFGREEEKLGRTSALSASADEETHLERDHCRTSGILPAEWPAFVCAASQVLSPEIGAAAKLPSHISIFGNNSCEGLGGKSLDGILRMQAGAAHQVMTERNMPRGYEGRVLGEVSWLAPSTVITCYILICRRSRWYQE
jgi:hypothetical protein